MNLEHKLCMGCMEEKPYDGPCRICGYMENTPHLPSFLAPETVLADRYIVGKLNSYNGEGGTYIGFDTVTGKKVTINEYMPDTICSRKKGQTYIEPESNHAALYKTYMSEFIELNKSLMKLRGMTHLQIVLDIFTENNTAYVIFEHIKGITLKTYLQNSSGELSWEQVKELFPPILTTLSLVHSSGILHRGISLNTIMVTDKMQLKLTGFCISATRTANSQLASELYAGYAAPEQYSSSDWHGAFTDVYGISAVLYRVLTGVMPSEALGRISSDNLIEPALVNRNVPANVSKVLMSGLSLAADARIRTITEFVDKLFEKPKFIPQTQQIAMDIKKEKAVAANAKTTISKEEKKQKEQKKRITIYLTIAIGIVLVFILTIILIQLNNDKFDKNDSEPEDIFTTAQTTAETMPQTEETEEVSIRPTIEVPDFTNRKYAETVINYEGKLVLEQKAEYTDDYAKGVMYNQSVAVGEKVPFGTKITVYVSKGPRKVKLPEFKGVKLKDYLETLGNLQITYDIIEDFKTNEVPTGEIYSTSKAPGELVDVSKSEKIIIYVAKNYPESTAATISPETEPQNYFTFPQR